VALGAAVSLIFGHIGAEWLRVSLVAQVIVVGALGTVLARQIAILRRTQGSLVAANADLAGAQASLETSNRILRATQKELQRARQQLIDGIEGLSDGLALYDAEDRLVVCNSGYQRLFGLHPDLLKPGTPFADILRAHVSAGRVTAAIGREEEWVAERLAQHCDPGGLFERNIDGHWFRFSDRPTSEGGTVTIFTQIDELKQREQRLRENQAILQSILDNIPVTVSITDRERRIVLLNRRIEDLYGVHQAEVVGRSIDEVRPRRYAGDSAVRDHFRVVETGEPILGREDDYAEGRESWITSVVPIKGQDGAARYVLRTTFEVPQLAKANRELADYRAFLVEAERQARIASWQQTPEGDFRTVWSENVEAVIGYPGSRICDDAAYLAVIHPADRDRIDRLFGDIDRHPRSHEAEYQVVRGDGRTIWVRGITKVELDAAGDVVRYIGTIQDITEAKRAEQALRDSETLLKEAQRRARLAYWLWDPEARRYLLAAEAETILGLPVDDLATNDHFLPFIHEDDRAWVAEAFRGQTERLEPCVIEYRWCRPDGQVIWLRDMCQQERDADGQVRRLVGTIQDVTEQKRAEEALRENQALLLAAQRRARIAYWLEDAGVGRGYTTSDFMAEVLGVPAGAIPSSDGDYLQLVHPDDRAAVAHAYQRAVAANMPYAIEYRVLRGDGGIGWVRELAEFQARPGRPDRLIGTIQDITEQKSIEAALRASEARLRAFMDHAPVAMFVKDLDGRFTMLNRHDAAFFGLPPEEIVGRRSADLLAGDDAAIVEAHDRVVLAGGAPVERELHFANRPRIEWSYEVKFPIMDAGGKVVALGGVAVDISALKRTEQALRNSEARMRAFMDHAPMLIYLKDIDGRYQLVNREFEQVEGVREDQLRGKTVFDVLPPDYAAPFADSDREVLTFGQMVVRENHDPVRTIYRDSLAVKFPVRDSHGAIIGIGGFTQDITERKRAENALRESEARLRRAQLQAKLASWSWNLETDTYVWAPGSGLALGLSDADLPLANAAYSALVHPDDRDALWRLYVEVEAGRDVFTTEFRIRRPGGEVIWVEEIGEVGRDAIGRRVSVSGTLQDVSERKRAEAALRDSEARLRGFLDHAPFAMYLKDTDLRYLLVNRAVEQFQGMTAAEICGRTPDQIYPPRLAERFAAEDREVLAQGAPVTFEYSDPAMSSYADSLTVRFPVRDSSGRIVAIGGITQDITERKQAERALKGSEARLKDAQRRAKLAYWSWDPLARAYVFGEEYTDIIGVESVQDIQTDDQYLHFVHEADRDWVTASLQRQRDDLEPGLLEYRVRRPDGRIVWLRDSCEQERDADGRVVRLAGTVQDVTEQKQAELALRDSEARLRGFLDHAPFTIYLRDTQHRYLLVNREIENFTGRTAADICGKTPADLYPPEQAREYVENDLAVLRLGAPITVESTYPSATTYAETVTVRFPVRDSSGRIVAIGGITQDVTERKQAERALRASEARLRSFMENAPVAVAIKDLERRFVLLNSKIELAFGRPAAEIIGRRTADLSDSDGARAVDILEREVVATGNVVTAEIYFPERQALPWTFEVKFPIRDAAGTLVAIGGVAVDITDRKRAELALAESEARFRSFMDNAPFDMIVKDLDGRYLMVNRGVERAWGVDAAEILGHRLPELSRSDGVAQVETIEREVADTGRVVAREVHFTDLGPEWTYEVKFPIRDPRGRIVALGGVALDITDRKKAQMALAASEARLQRAQQQARLAYWSWQFATASAPEEFRWSPGSGELLGMPDAEMPRNDAQAMHVTHPEDRDRLRRLYNEVRAGLDHYAVEYRARRRDGGIVWVREVAEVVRDAEGRRTAVEGTMQDITEQRALEEQLRQAQKMESIGQLTGGIAHDFNNLMAVILGNLELLAEDLAGDPAALQKIETAIRSTLRGSDLTQRLLAFARQQSLAPKLTQIGELIRSMRDLLLRPIGPAIEVSFVLADDLWPAEIDQARLETSLLNLVINARDAMPDGGRLAITADNVTIESDDGRESEGLPAGAYVRITVADSGQGMTEEVRARAFDPFFTTKGVGKGTGLGLSMVYGFVKQSGGHVELVSEVGRGTTVTIYLPAARAAAATALRPVDPAGAVREAPEHRGGP
jgi:PAS domain S-box-containing protein